MDNPIEDHDLINLVNKRKIYLPLLNDNHVLEIMKVIYTKDQSLSKILNHNEMIFKTLTSFKV